MKRILSGALLAALLAPISSHASDAADGILNPEEMSLNRALSRAREGDVDMMVCALGYGMTKMGNHVEARTVFETCARRGWTGAMTWMSYLDSNAYGAAENPKAAAEWDRKAAELGDPIGQFNYGLDLLRGHGVAPNSDLGRQFIDKAAEQGLGDARRLQGAGYDPNEVTPDADNWKYQRLF